MKESSQAPLGAAAAREGLAGVIDRWWIVAIVAIVGGLVGFLSGAPNGSDHRVGMTMGLDPTNGNTSLVQLGVSTPPGPSTSQFFGDQVIGDLAGRLGMSPATVRTHLDATEWPQPSGDVQIELDATGASTANATQLLRAWFESIQRHRRQAIHRLLDNAEHGLLHGRTRAMAAGDRARATELTALLARLDALRASYGTDVYAVRWGVDTSVLGSQRSSTFKGLLGGVVAGVLIALAISLFDGRLRTPTAIEFAFGLPALADLRSRSGGSLMSIDDRLDMLAGRQRVDSVVLTRLTGSPSEEHVVEKLRAKLTTGTEVTLGPLPGDPKWLSVLRAADFWVVAASPGEVTIRVAGQVSEMVGRGEMPPGALVYI